MDARIAALRRARRLAEATWLNVPQGRSALLACLDAPSGPPPSTDNDNVQFTDLTNLDAQSLAHRPARRDEFYA